MYSFKFYYKDKNAYIQLVDYDDTAIAERRVRLGWGFMLNGRIRRVKRRLIRCEIALKKQAG